MARFPRWYGVGAVLVGLAVWAVAASGAAKRGEFTQGAASEQGVAGAAHELDRAGGEERSWRDIITPGVLLASLVLLCFSAFFSASEVAFYSLHRLRLRSMRASPQMLDRLVSRLMEQPGGLLASILMGNCIVNVLLGVILAARVEEAFQMVLPLPVVVSYALAVALCTSVLVFFGEVSPKLLVVRSGEAYARYAAVPIFLTDRLLMPIRDGLLVFIGFLFRVTRFSQMRPSPFMTDEEFKSLLSQGEASGAIEEEERQMIQGILEFSDVMVKEILMPRLDMVVLKEDVTVGEALTLLREHEFARIPVYRDDLDTITGVLFAKDLLPGVERGDLDSPIKPLLRKPYFVPETMSVADFVRAAQRLRAHLAIVVDEFGGTEGLVTLQDALREVVGDIGEEDEAEQPPYVKLDDGTYRVSGKLALDELEQLLGREVKNAAHATVAGLLMEQTDKILEVGDTIEYEGVRYTVEEMDGRRVSRLRLQALDRPEAQAGRAHTEGFSAP